jgi:nitrogen fixation NifU-like protein
VYNPTVLEHFKNPRNAGEIKDADGVGMVGNPSCGDVMKMFITVKENRIVDIRHKTFGCGAAIACSSKATEIVKGKTLEEAGALTRDEVANELNGLPPEKMSCSNLAPDAIRAAIGDFLSKSK